MPLVQWLLNLEPIQSVSVSPSSGQNAENVLTSTVLFQKDILEKPSPPQVRDVVELPATASRPPIVGTPRLGHSKDLEGPTTSQSRSITPKAVTRAKTLSSSSATSKAISGKPTIRRRS